MVLALSKYRFDGPEIEIHQPLLFLLEKWSRKKSIYITKLIYIDLTQSAEQRLLRVLLKCTCMSIPNNINTAPPNLFAFQPLELSGDREGEKLKKKRDKQADGNPLDLSGGNELNTT